MRTTLADRIQRIYVWLEANHTHLLYFSIFFVQESDGESPNLTQRRRGCFYRCCSRNLRVLCRILLKSAWQDCLIGLQFARPEEGVIAAGNLGAMCSIIACSSACVSGFGAKTLRFSIQLGFGKQGSQSKKGEQQKVSVCFANARKSRAHQ